MSFASYSSSVTHVPSLFCSVVLFSLSPMDDDNTPSFHVQPKSKRAKNPHPRAYIYHKNRVCLHIFIIIDGDTWHRRGTEISKRWVDLFRCLFFYIIPRPKTMMVNLNRGWSWCCQSTKTQKVYFRQLPSLYDERPEVDFHSSMKNITESKHWSLNISNSFFFLTIFCHAKRWNSSRGENKNKCFSNMP